MKRLLGWIGITYLSVLAVVFYFDKTITLKLAGIFLMLFIVFMVINRCRKRLFLPVIALAAAIACIANVAYTTITYDKTVSSYDGFEGVVTAQLIGQPQKYYDYYKYCFDAQMAGEEKCDFFFVAYCETELNIKPYDIAEIDVELSQTDSKSNIADGYFFSTYLFETDNAVIVYKMSQKPFLNLVIEFRESVRNKIKNLLNEDTSRLCQAIFMGDKYALDKDMYRSFREAGVSHLVVVSGMHFSILTCLFFWCARRIGKLKIFFSICAILFIITYMFFVGFTPSVVRSGIMLLVYAFGIIVSRETYSLNSLGLAALVLTIGNPFAAGDVSLVLSFATTLSIVVFAPGIYEYFYNRIIIKVEPHKNAKRARKWILKRIVQILKFCFFLLSANICATLASIPLSIIFFNSVSTVSIVTTFILSPLVQLLLYMTVVLVVLSFIPFMSWFLFIPVFCVEICADVILKTVSFFAGFEFAYLNVSHDFVYLWLLLSAILFILTLMSDYKHRIRLFVISSITLLLIGYVSDMFIMSCYSTLNVYDCGNGLVVMYSDKDVNAVLSVDCDGQNRYEVIEKIEGDTNTVDFCSSVKGDSKSYKTLCSLSESFAISDVLLYDKRRTFVIEETGEPATELKGDYSIKLSENASAYYYKIDDAYVTYLDTVSSTTLLFNDSVDVNDLPENLRRADTIVFTNDYPKNYELLRCDTLVVSATESDVYSILKHTEKISNKAYLTAERDVKLLKRCD